MSQPNLPSPQTLCLWGTPHTPFLPPSSSPAPRLWRLNIPIKEICCGQQHLLFLSTDKRVYTIGDNTHGQLGIPNNDPSIASPPNTTPNLIKSLPQIHSISSGWHHNAALTFSGQVYTWGQSPAAGSLPSTPSHQPHKLPFPYLHSQKIVRVQCGARHSMFLSNLGRLYGCGDNQHGQLGLQSKKSFVTPELVPFEGAASQIACGISHSLVLNQRQMLFASGLNTFGQLGTGTNKSVTRFVRAMTDVMFTRVRCGHHSAGLSVGHELYLWGTGAFGELLTPTKCLDVKIRRIEMGDTYGLAQDFTGQIYTWGSNVAGQLGHGDFDSRPAVSRVTIPVEGLGAVGCGGDIVVVCGKEKEQPKTRELKGSKVDVLLSEQKYLQNNYELERGLVRSLESVNAELRNRNCEITEKMAEVSEEYGILKGMYEDLQLQLQQLKEQFGQQIRKTEIEKDTQKDGFIKQLKQKVEDREAQILQLRKHRDISDERCNSLKSRITQLQALSTQLSTQISTLQTTNQSLTIQSATTTTTNLQLQSKLPQLQKTIQSYILESYSLKLTNKELTTSLQSLTQAYNATSQRLADLEKQNTELNKQLAERKLDSYRSPRLDQEETLRQNDIELHNYKKLLEIKDRELRELRKAGVTDRGERMEVGLASSVGMSCRQGLKAVSLLEESQGSIDMFRQLIRDVFDQLDDIAI